MHFSHRTVRHSLKWKGYTNCGGCQMGNATSVTPEETKLEARLLSKEGMVFIAAIKWLMEKLLQQVQWQKGEQSSCCWSSCGWLHFVKSVFILPWISDLSLSAQGIMLSVKTRNAIMKAKNFIECKGNLMSVKYKWTIMLVCEFCIELLTYALQFIKTYYYQ